MICSWFISDSEHTDICKELPVFVYTQPSNTKSTDHTVALHTLQEVDSKCKKNQIRWQEEWMSWEPWHTNNINSCPFKLEAWNLIAHWVLNVSSVIPKKPDYSLWPMTGSAKASRLTPKHKRTFQITASASLPSHHLFSSHSASEMFNVEDR